jgi:hypothetical protein
MARIKKRDEKKMQKTFYNHIEARNKGKAIELQVKRKPLLLDKVHIKENEFTVHSGIKKIAAEFLQSASDLETMYQGGKKKLIIAFAYDLEMELKRLGEDHLVSRISTFIMGLLKNAGLRWSPMYLRRCLDNRYKEPINRLNALARSKQNPGMVSDSGRSQEQLEADLSQKAIGEYVVKKDFRLVKSFKTSKEFKPFMRKFFSSVFSYKPDKDAANLILTLPAIIKVNVKERDAILEADIDALNQRLESQSQPKPKPRLIEEDEVKNIIGRFMSRDD